MPHEHLSSQAHVHTSFDPKWVQIWIYRWIWETWITAWWKHESGLRSYWIWIVPHIPPASCPSVLVASRTGIEGHTPPQGPLQECANKHTHTHTKMQLRKTHATKSHFNVVIQLSFVNFILNRFEWFKYKLKKMAKVHVLRNGAETHQKKSFHYSQSWW